MNLLNTTNDPCTTLITFIDNRSLIPTLSRPGTFYHALDASLIASSKARGHRNSREH